MGSLHLDSRQIIPEFIGFLAGEGLLWRVIDYTAQEHGITLQGTDHDYLTWFREFLAAQYSASSLVAYAGLLSGLFSWDSANGGYVYWESVQLKWASVFRMLYPLEVYAS